MLVFTSDNKLRCQVGMCTLPATHQLVLRGVPYLKAPDVSYYCQQHAYQRRGWYQGRFRCEVTASVHGFVVHPVSQQV